jgi:choline dehydrogenase-like flavoprotein
VNPADITSFCGCEVRYIKPCSNGPNKWTVHFAWHGDKREKFKDSIYSELMWVQAKEFVFLGAGAIGTTEILLRSHAYGLKTSPTLGRNMSGNGDILAFGYNGKKIANAIGTQKRSYLDDHPVGPTITGIIDMRDEAVAPNVLDGYVIEEGAVPSALAGVLQTMFDVIPGQVAPTGLSLFDRLQGLKNEAAAHMLSAWHQGGALNRTMVYLMMSHDDNQATLSLQNNKPNLEFIGVGRNHHVKTLNRILQKAANGVDAKFIPNPFSAPSLGHGEITVHPIGGANMSSDGTGMSGVTDQFGQVFKGNTAEVYDGLVVVDGSVVPTSLGVNPFATITALAERSVAGVAKDKGIEIDYESKNGFFYAFIISDDRRNRLGCSQGQTSVNGKYDSSTESDRGFSENWWRSVYRNYGGLPLRW